MLDKGVAGQFGSVRKITARSLIGFSRFDVIQNSFSESTVYWHYVVNIRFWIFFKYMYMFTKDLPTT